MNNSDVMQAVEARLKGAFPDPVYVDRLPKDFARPSFAVELQKAESVDLNLSLVQRTATVLVTGFVPVDPYYDSSREALNSRQDTVMDLFACGRLPVGDRYPTVTADKGKGSPDFFEVQVTISWIDSRPEVWGPPAQAPMMERYELNREFPGNKTER